MSFVNWGYRKERLKKVSIRQNFMEWWSLWSRSLSSSWWILPLDTLWSSLETSCLFSRTMITLVLFWLKAVCAHSLPNQISLKLPYLPKLPWMWLWSSQIRLWFLCMFLATLSQWKAQWLTGQVFRRFLRWKSFLQFFSRYFFVVPPRLVIFRSGIQDRFFSFLRLQWTW